MQPPNLLIKALRIMHIAAVEQDPSLLLEQNPGNDGDADPAKRSPFLSATEMLEMLIQGAFCPLRLQSPVLESLNEHDRYYEILSAHNVNPSLCVTQSEDVFLQEFVGLTVQTNDFDQDLEISGMAKNPVNQAVWQEAKALQQSGMRYGVEDLLLKVEIPPAAAAEEGAGSSSSIQEEAPSNPRSDNIAANNSENDEESKADDSAEAKSPSKRLMENRRSLRRRKTWVSDPASGIPESEEETAPATPEEAGGPRT